MRLKLFVGFIFNSQLYLSYGKVIKLEHFIPNEGGDLPLSNELMQQYIHLQTAAVHKTHIFTVLSILIPKSFPTDNHNFWSLITWNGFEPVTALRNTL